MANILKAHDNLIPVSEFIKTRLNRFGDPVTSQSVYKLIGQHKLNPNKKIGFEYVDKGKHGIWIVKVEEKTTKKAKKD